jgi:hypothetical protein
MGLRVSRRNAFTSTFWMLIFLDRQDHSRERLAISFLNIFCVAVSISVNCSQDHSCFGETAFTSQRAVRQQRQRFPGPVLRR